MPRTGSDWRGLFYLFDFFIHLTFSLCLWATSHATLITVYGPTIALKCLEFETVSTISQMIQTQKYFVLWIGGLALTSLFLASIMNYWAKLTWPIALLVTVINVVGFIILFLKSLEVYNIFHPGQEVELMDLLGGVITWKRSSMSYMMPLYTLKLDQGEQRKEDEKEDERGKGSRGGEDEEKYSFHEGNDELTLSEVSQKASEVNRKITPNRPRGNSAEANDEYLNKSKEILRYQQVHVLTSSLLTLPDLTWQMTQTRAQGMIWWKSPLSAGGDGKFHSRFAVIEKGILNFYRNEEVLVLPSLCFSPILILNQAFNSNDRALNEEPYPIWLYRLETQYR
jgi:hypothetical protein